MGAIAPALLAACHPAPEPARGPDVPHPGLTRAFAPWAFQEPVDVDWPPGRRGRAAVAEAGGRVWLVGETGDASPTLMLDLSAQVSREGPGEGLLAVAFHPQYAANGYFYVHYVAREPRRTVLARFSTDRTTGRALPASETAVLAFEQLLDGGKGGALAFGPDGALWLGTGDGGLGDPFARSQDLDGFFGKLLRLDVDAAAPYGVPADNPFHGRRGARTEVWASGFQDVRGLAFGPDGAVYVSDGHEVAAVQAGENHGWPLVAGTRCRAGQRCAGLALTPPLVHDPAASFAGGLYYTGRAHAAWRDAFLHADLRTGRVWRIQPGARPARVPALDVDLPLSGLAAGADGEPLVLTARQGIYRPAAGVAASAR